MIDKCRKLEGKKECASGKNRSLSDQNASDSGYPSVVGAALHLKFNNWNLGKIPTRASRKQKDFESAEIIGRDTRYCIPSASASARVSLEDAYDICSFTNRGYSTG
jgi:hypothetical protein